MDQSLAMDIDGRLFGRRMILNKLFQGSDIPGDSMQGLITTVEANGSLSERNRANSGVAGQRSPSSEKRQTPERMEPLNHYLFDWFEVDFIVIRWQP
jgi:hypothetical protein